MTKITEEETVWIKQNNVSFDHVTFELRGTYPSVIYSWKQPF